MNIEAAKERMCKTCVSPRYWSTPFFLCVFGLTGSCGNVGAGGIRKRSPRRHGEQVLTVKISLLQNVRLGLGLG